jgi:type IX secretion system PorP/SprF family membrane protein
MKFLNPEYLFMNLRQIILIVASVSASMGALAQQQVMFTQYMFNSLAINPAYAGSHESLSMSALARTQWTGLDGAPQTQTFSVHSPIRHQRMALGAMFMHDKIGVTNQNGAYVMYAYRIPTSEKGRLAFGLQGGFSTYNAQFSKVSITDPKFASDIRLTHPSIGFGMYYNTDRFYAGLSIPQINQSDLDRTNPDSDSKLVRHYFLTAGYVFDINPALKLKPNILVKSVGGAPVQLDLNVNLLIQDVLWVGASWRSFDSIDALLQFQISEQLQIGYSFDFATTTELSRVNGGSHEFMVNYRLAFTRNRIITPRYF